MSNHSLGGTRSRWRLVLSFGLIAMVFAASEVVAMMRAGAVQREIRQTIDGAVNSLETVGQLNRQLSTLRLLVAQHVFESRQHAMAELEERIASVEAQLFAGAKSFAAPPDFPGERQLAGELTAQLSTLAEPIAEVIQLSRLDRDREAADSMRGLEDDFEGAGGTLRQLWRVSQEGMSASQSRVSELERRAMYEEAALEAFGIVWTLLVGAFAIRLVHQRESQLARSAAMLLERNRELDAFAARVAHDLRGPLNTVALAGTSLARRTRGSEPLGESLQRGVRRMDAIISDLLALSRATSGDALCQVSEVVREVQDELAPRVEREGGSLLIDAVPALLRCSHGLLHQALVNLADNALKYRRADVRAVVEIEGRIDGDFYELRVSDNGVGMSPEESARLFEPFFRARRIPEATGTGLGLTIVKRVAESAGGSVTAHSSLGRGTTFVMRLPLAPPGAARS